VGDFAFKKIPSLLAGIFLLKGIHSRYYKIGFFVILELNKTLR